MLDRVIWGNTVQQYAEAAALFALCCGLIYIVRRFVLDRLRAVADNAPTPLRAAQVECIDQFRGPETLLLALWISIRHLALDHAAIRYLHLVIIIALTYRFVRLGQNIISLVVHRIVSGGDEHSQAHSDTARNIVYLVNGLLWLAGLSFILAGLGIKLTALLTGLGIGGVAVALAAQAILSDVFSAVVIFLDKPFGVGDDIALDNDWAGKVVRIGLKTTRVRAATGEMLVFPNSTLTVSKLRNLSRRIERRVVFGWSLAQGTAPEKLRRTVDLAKEIVSKSPQVRLERAHFKGIGPWAMDFEICYTVHDSDYERYLDVNQEIQLALVEGLKREGIELAPPKG